MHSQRDKPDQGYAQSESDATRGRARPLPVAVNTTFSGRPPAHSPAAHARSRSDGDDPYDHESSDAVPAGAYGYGYANADGYRYAAASAAPHRALLFPRALRRLRDRLQIQEDGLRLDVNALKQEIADLNIQRLVLNTKRTVQHQLLLEKSVDVVSEYFCAFQHGWISDETSADEQLAELQSMTGSSTFMALLRTPRQDHERMAFIIERQQLLMDRQQHFIATALDPAMAFGPARNGVEVFVREWKRCSDHHRLPRLTRVSMSCHGSADEPIIVALGTFSGKLTLRALEEKYPGALLDPKFVKQLVGAAIEYSSRETFHFSSSGLITRYDRGLDCVRAFARLLTSLDDVAVVLHGARLWDHEDEFGVVDGVVTSSPECGEVADDTPRQHRAQETATRR